MTDLDFTNEQQVSEDPEGATRTIRRERLKNYDAERRIEAFELVFAAFDELRRSEYVPMNYTPQWRGRAERAEARLISLAEHVDAEPHGALCKPWRLERWPDDPAGCVCRKRALIEILSGPIKTGTPESTKELS